MLIDRNNWGGIRLNEASHFGGLRVVIDVSEFFTLTAITADFTVNSNIDLELLDYYPNHIRFSLKN